MKTKRLFVSFMYSTTVCGFGNSTLDNIDEPRDIEEVRVIQRLLEEKYEVKGVIIMWWKVIS